MSKNRKSVMRFLSISWVAGWLIMATTLSGCNAGAALFLLLLEDDDDDSQPTTTDGAGTASVSFLGIDNARSAPQDAILRITLDSEKRGQQIAKNSQKLD